MKFSKQNYFRNIKKENWKRLNEDVYNGVSVSLDEPAANIETMIPSTPFRDSGIQFEPVDSNDIVSSSAKDADVNYIKSLAEQMIDVLNYITENIVGVKESNGNNYWDCDYNQFEYHDIVQSMVAVAKELQYIKSTVQYSSQDKTTDEVVSDQVSTAVNDWYTDNAAQPAMEEYPNASEIVATAPDRINALVNGVEYTGSVNNIVDQSIQQWKPVL